MPTSDSVTAIDVDGVELAPVEPPVDSQRRRQIDPLCFSGRGAAEESDWGADGTGAAPWEGAVESQHRLLSAAGALEGQARLSLGSVARSPSRYLRVR